MKAYSSEIVTMATLVFATYIIQEENFLQGWFQVEGKLLFPDCLQECVSPQIIRN